MDKKREALEFEAEKEAMKLRRKLYQRVRLDTPILFGGKKIKAGVNLFGKVNYEELKIKGMISKYLNLKVKPTLTLSEKGKLYEGET